VQRLIQGGPMASSFSLEPGEDSLGLVEKAARKEPLRRAADSAYEPTADDFFAGEEISSLSESRAARPARKFQMNFSRPVRPRSIPMLVEV